MTQNKSSWELFIQTGDIYAYLMYRLQLEQEEMKDKELRWESLKQEALS